MSDAEYLTWTQMHTTLFYMHSEHDTELFRLWRPSLIAFTLAELTEASRWLAENEGGQFRTAHLTTLRRRVTVARMEHFRREQAQAGAVDNRCPLCRGTGCVVVPHKQFVVDDEWQFRGNTKPEGIVSCRCQAGLRKQGQFEAARMEKPRFSYYTIDEYESLVPHWRELLEQERQRQLAEARTHAAAEHADQRAPLSIEGIKRRLLQIGARK